MESLLTLFIVVMLIATVGSLFGGLGAMGIGGAVDDRNSERLMFTRVGLQAIAVLLAVLLLYAIRH